MAFIEDLDVFINDDTPGFKTLTIDGESISGIFTDDFQESNFVESSDPVFVTKESNVSNILNGSIVIDGEKSYRIIGIEDDGTGVTKLQLRLKI